MITTRSPLTPTALPDPLSIKTASPYRAATLHTPEGEWTLPIEDGTIRIPEPKLVEYGGVIVMK